MHRRYELVELVPHPSAPSQEMWLGLPLDGQSTTLLPRLELQLL